MAINMLGGHLTWMTKVLQSTILKMVLLSTGKGDGEKKEKCFPLMSKMMIIIIRITIIPMTTTEAALITAIIKFQLPLQM